MNKLSIVRSAAVALTIAASALLGCTKKEAVDPTPAAHTVEVRTTAVGIGASSGAVLPNAMVRLYGLDAQNNRSEFKTSEVALGEAVSFTFFDATKTQEYTLQVQLRGTQLTVPADLRVEARLYVDGALRTTTVMDKATSQRNQECTGTGPGKYCTARIETLLSNPW